MAGGEKSSTAAAWPSGAVESRCSDSTLPAGAAAVAAGSADGTGRPGSWEPAVDADGAACAGDAAVGADDVAVPLAGDAAAALAGDAEAVVGDRTGGGTRLRTRVVAGRWALPVEVGVHARTQVAAVPVP